MATRSAIGILRENGSIEAVYCHWDGYLSGGVGQTLFENYNSFSKVEELVSYGNISSLGEEIGDKHDFDTRVEGVSTFYKRDRGENGNEAKTFSNKLSFHQHYNGSDFYYLYDETKNEWFFKPHDAIEYRSLEEYFIGE